jgi:hypothetical protein
MICSSTDIPGLWVFRGYGFDKKAFDFVVADAEGKGKKRKKKKKTEGQRREKTE